jgi:hypothetical protein
MDEFDAEFKQMMADTQQQVNARFIEVVQSISGALSPQLMGSLPSDWKIGQSNGVAPIRNCVWLFVWYHLTL